MVARALGFEPNREDGGGGNGPHGLSCFSSHPDKNQQLCFAKGSSFNATMRLLIPRFAKSLNLTKFGTIKNQRPWWIDGCNIKNIVPKLSHAIQGIEETYSGNLSELQLPTSSGGVLPVDGQSTFSPEMSEIAKISDFLMDFKGKVSIESEGAIAVQFYVSKLT